MARSTAPIFPWFNRNQGWRCRLLLLRARQPRHPVQQPAWRRRVRQGKRSFEKILQGRDKIAKAWRRTQKFRQLRVQSFTVFLEMDSGPASSGSLAIRPERRPPSFRCSVAVQLPVFVPGLRARVWLSAEVSARMESGRRARIQSSTRPRQQITGTGLASSFCPKNQQQMRQ